MKFSLIASGLALAASAIAVPAPAAAAAAEVEERTLFFGCLNSFTAQIIVNKYISILENQPYFGQSVNTTADQIIAVNYVEYSDSILSLEKAPLGNTPSATSKAQWVSEVTQHPEVGIQTLDIMNSCNKIMWHWNFPSVGGGSYEVKGFNLLTVNFQGQITRADIEFNSIAWGLDTQQIYQYCPTS